MFFSFLFGLAVQGTGTHAALEQQRYVSSGHYGRYQSSLLQAFAVREPSNLARNKAFQQQEQRPVSFLKPDSSTSCLSCNPRTRGTFMQRSTAPFYKRSWTKLSGYLNDHDEDHHDDLHHDDHHDDIHDVHLDDHHDDHHDDHLDDHHDDHHEIHGYHKHNWHHEDDLWGHFLDDHDDELDDFHLDAHHDDHHDDHHEEEGKFLQLGTQVTESFGPLGIVTAGYCEAQLDMIVAACEDALARADPDHPEDVMTPPYVPVMILGQSDLHRTFGELLHELPLRDCILPPDEDELVLSTTTTAAGVKDNVLLRYPLVLFSGFEIPQLQQSLRNIESMAATGAAAASTDGSESAVVAAGGIVTPMCAMAVPNAMEKEIGQLLEELEGDHEEATSGGGMGGVPHEVAHETVAKLPPP